MVVLLMMMLWIQSTRLTAAVGGSGVAAVSQQGLRVEHTTRAQTGGVPLYGIPLDIYVNTVELKT